MPCYLIPFLPTSTSIELWAAWWQDGEPEAISIIINPDENDERTVETIENWTKLGRSGEDNGLIFNRMLYRYVSVDGLTPGTSYRASLRDNDGNDLAVSS